MSRLFLKKIILCDFDGTIVTHDTAEYILENFTKENWKIYDEMLEKGELSLEEAIIKQFKLITISKEKIIEVLEKTTFFLPNFEKFVKYCKKNSLTLKIVSAGLDFVIEHFIQKIDKIEIYAAKTINTDEGIEVVFDQFQNDKSLDFKNDIVRSYKKCNYVVYYIGDSSSDYGAVKEAELSFVVKSSKLHSYCLNRNITHFPFTNYEEIINYFEKLD